MSFGPATNNLAVERANSARFQDHDVVSVESIVKVLEEMGVYDVIGVGETRALAARCAAKLIRDLDPEVIDVRNAEMDVVKHPLE